jgi:hypothetical protein
MKINWGVGITMLYLGFVAMILLLVGMSFNQKIDLATDHYYAEEVHFQDKINKTNRAKALADPLTWEVSEQGLKIHYPEHISKNPPTGKVKLYCPSNDKNDRSFNISSHNGEQFIPATDIPAGRYRLQIDWKYGDQTYWNEDVILISHTK